MTGLRRPLRATPGHGIRSGRLAPGRRYHPPRGRSERGFARRANLVGNVHQLASLLNSAAYAAFCLGRERDATEFAARATPIARALDSPFERMIDSGNRGLAAVAVVHGDDARAAYALEEPPV
jgi:hypothetical protein